jgi:hypothetical protein
MDITRENDDFDSPWKKILEKYFQDFMLFFFPEIHAEIDWQRGYDFMDQEFQQIVRDADLKKRYVDKLVKVWNKSGVDQIVFVHIEVQNQEESGFGKRMFVYNYRIRDCYDEKIVSLAVLGDDRKNWRPKPFEDSLWGCKVTFEFPIVKLSDYESCWIDLENSRNPFAVVVMAHLKTKATQQDLKSRKEWKFQLTRQLYEQGFARQDIIELFLFIDWLMELPEELKQEFKTELKQYEEAKQMRYVSSIEEMAVEDNRREIALAMLADRVPLETIARYTKLSIEQINVLQSQQQGQNQS